MKAIVSRCCPASYAKRWSCIAFAGFLIAKVIIAEVFTAGLLIACVPSIVIAQQMQAPQKRPNVVMIVADDMNWDTPGCFGGAADGVTPNIDRLATQGMRFWHAYVNVSICTPSRSVLLSGLYSCNNGAEGFQRIRAGTETLPAVLNKSGYVCGIVGKPLRQQELFRWSMTYRWQGVGDEDRWGRDPETYRRFARSLFAMSKASQQPFFLMANSHDPHRPFAGGKATRDLDERVPASRTFSADEVNVPAFLPDLPAVRRELAEYCTSVRRLDDMVGVVLDELNEAELVENTMVIFLADHGMPFPGAKFNCYPDSVRTPLVVRWPGHVEAGSVDRQHMVSGVDLMPTILAAVGLPVGKSDGRSFLPVLQGEAQDGRDQVFAQFHHIHGKDALPMRSVLTKDAAYVFNPWSNGQRRFGRNGGDTFRAMQQAAVDDARMAARVNHLSYRTVEEFYDLRVDPGCLNNLLGDSQALDAEQRKLLEDSRQRLRDWMVDVEDAALNAFDRRDDRRATEKFLQDYRARAAQEVEDLIPYERSQGFRF